MPGGTQSEQDLWETAAMKGWTAAKKIKQLEADMGPNGIAELGTSLISKQINNYAKTLINHLKTWEQPKAAEKAPLPIPDPPKEITGGPFIAHVSGITKSSMSPAEKVAALQESMTKTALPAESIGGKYILSVIAALKGEAPTAPTATEFPKAPAPYVENNTTVKNFVAAAKSGMNTSAQLQTYLENLESLGDVTPGTYHHNYAKQIVAWKQAQEDGGAPAAATTIEAPTASNIPKWSGMSSTPSLQANMAYNLATNAGLSTTEKIEKIKTYQAKKISEGTFIPGSAVDEYIKSVITALDPTAATEKPQPPPTVNDPKQGSQTQNKMWTVAIDNPSGPGGKTNTEKIAEITKILAESSGGLGGEAEKYANHLITALGGQPTDKDKAQAAQPKATPYGATPSYTQQTPAAPAGPPLSFSSEINSTQYASYKKGAPKPKPDERTAVKAYTNGEYTEINDSLRHGYGLPPNLIQTIKNVATFLDRAKFPEDVTVTRKIGGSYAKELLQSNSLTKGGIFIDRGFSSTDHWSGDLTIKIKIKKGQKAAAVGHLSAHPSRV